MSTPDQDRLDAIIQRLDALEARFRRLEAVVGIEPPPAPVIAQTVRETVHATPPPLPVEIPAPPAEPALETQVGLNWINRIAVVTLIFGSAFFFKYAIDNNWIGPGTRVALGVAAAAVALLSGDRMWHRGHKVFAHGLTGLGLAVLYLSFYAAFALYSLLPQSATFLLMVLTTLSSAMLALRYDSQAIAVLCLFGGYATPLMLSTGEDHPWFLFGYTFVLNLGALALVRIRRWRAVEYIAFGATVVLFAGWFFSWFGMNNRTVATVFAVAFWAQFAASDSRIVWLFAQLAASIGAVAIWDKPETFLFLELLFAAGGLLVAYLRRWNDAPSWTLFCYWFPYAGWAANSGLAHDRVAIFATLSCAFVLFFLWTPCWAGWEKRAVRGTDLSVLAANAAAYFGASYYLLNPVYHEYMGLFAVGLGAVHLLAAKLLWNPSAIEDRDKWPALLSLSVTLTFLTLAIPIQFAGFRISMAWALEGAALSWLAARFESERLRIASWIVLFLVIGRLFAFDSLIYANGKQFAPIVNTRFLTFVLSAASLWLAAWFARTGMPAAIPYTAGHFVMLWILGLEVIGWAERSISSANLLSVETTAISILMAVYALALVSIGVAWRTVINRMLGLGLLAIVVAKLYLSDVWELGLVFRITAFLGLGALLLVVSYLYSRFKPVIEKLWRDDAAS